MRTETFEGTVEAYQGKNLDTPIKFSGNASLYENVAEAKASEDWPGDSEVLKMVNTKKVTSAKAAEYQKATKVLKEAYEASDDYKRKNLVTAMLAAGFSQVEAEAMTSQKLG